MCLAQGTPDIFDAFTHVLAHQVMNQHHHHRTVEALVGFCCFERVVFPLAAPVIGSLTGHPATIQYPPQMLRAEIERVFEGPVEMEEISRGTWILQYGYKFPSVLTPARPFLFRAKRQ